MSRKLVVIAAAAALGLAVATSPAEAQSVGGYAGIYAGALLAGGSGVPAAAVDAAVNVRFGNLNIELETRGFGLFAPPSPIIQAASLVHAYYRNTGFALGAFAGYERGGATNTLYAGAEAQAYLNQVTLYAQAAYVTLSAGGPSTPGWLARTGLRFFPIDRLAFDASVRYQNAGGAVLWTVVHSAEFQLPSQAVSLLVHLRETLIPSGPSFSLTALFGFRIRFGGTLQDQAAPMDTLPLLL
jgi:hypothetical protein